jgi:predicted  nucleic acid-binding Zn-ribbon protein
VTDNLLETIPATVQDFLAPEIRTHTVRLEALDHKIDETKETLIAKIDAVANSVEETKQTLRADIRTVEVRIQSLENQIDVRIQSVDVRIQGIENLIHQLMHQISLEGSLRERIASLEARIPQH